MATILSATSSFNGETDRRARLKLLGSVAYVAPGIDTASLPRLVSASGAEFVTMQDVIALWPSNPLSKDAFFFGNCAATTERPPCDSADVGLSARNITGFGGPVRFAPTKGSQWTSSNIVSAESPATLEQSRKGTVFAPAGDRGAAICYQYHDGVLTTRTPLAMADGRPHQAGDGRCRSGPRRRYPNYRRTLRADP